MPGAKKSYDVRRCAWVQDDPLLKEYHDTEWGRLVRDDRAFFEALCLESLQAGLSWRTILVKRAAYRRYFCHFKPSKVAVLTDSYLEHCAQNPELIRHKGKTFALRKNARVFCAIQKKYGSFECYVCGFMTKSHVLSKDLKKQGMFFVGPTIIHAFMQAVGLVNGHDRLCFLNNH